MDFDKVFTAFRNCISEPKCKDCPWEQCEQFNQKKVSIPVTLALDVLNLLKEQRWIPVSERLPKSMVNKVLVYLQHENLVDQIGYGHYEKFQGVEMWYNLEIDEQFSKRGYTVTHWMPLPESPKGERLALS